MGITETIAKSLETAEKLRTSKAANESNTKALLIEPLLAALGWDPFDLDAVQREVKVFDGTFLDYALKLGGTPRLYVEAKAVDEKLTDNKYVAQAVNYANNDGIVWCVLTNGLQWRIYKANETAPMDRKLLLEVDLAESDTAAATANQLRLLSHEAVSGGELDRYGERVFTDGRVRQALAHIAANPPEVVLDAVKAKLGHPGVTPDALRRSLSRIWDAPVTSDVSSSSGINAQSKATSPLGPPQPPKGQEYTLDHHLANKSAAIRELFGEVNDSASALGADVTRRIRSSTSGSSAARNPSLRSRCRSSGRLSTSHSSLPRRSHGTMV